MICEKASAEAKGFFCLFVFFPLLISPQDFQRAAGLEFSKEA